MKNWSVSNVNLSGFSDKLKNKDVCKRQVLGRCKQRLSVLVGNLQVFGKAKDVSVLVAI
jgi:hypothetical protein